MRSELTVTHKLQDRVAWIGLNRPHKRNAINDALLAEFERAIRQARTRLEHWSSSAAAPASRPVSTWQSTAHESPKRRSTAREHRTLHSHCSATAAFLQSQHCMEQPLEAASNWPRRAISVSPTKRRFSRFRKGSAASMAFDALVFGYYEAGRLMYAARTRNGFTPKLRDELLKRFRALETANCPFANLPEKKSGRWGAGLTATKMQECRWLKPELVGQFEYVEWTHEGHLRHSRFIGLREDKKPKDVVREK